MMESNFDVILAALDRAHEDRPFEYQKFLEGLGFTVQTVRVDADELDEDELWTPPEPPEGYILAWDWGTEDGDVGCFFIKPTNAFAEMLLGPTLNLNQKRYTSVVEMAKDAGASPEFLSALQETIDDRAEETNRVVQEHIDAAREEAPLPSAELMTQRIHEGWQIVGNGELCNLVPPEDHPMAHACAMWRSISLHVPHWIVGEKTTLPSGQQIETDRLKALAEFIGCDPDDIEHVRFAKQPKHCVNSGTGKIQP